ncbi:hypothetical protein D3C78_1222990 [compost metagenome]
MITASAPCLITSFASFLMTRYFSPCSSKLSVAMLAIAAPLIRNAIVMWCPSIVNILRAVANRSLRIDSGPRADDGNISLGSNPYLFAACSVSAKSISTFFCSNFIAWPVASHISWLRASPWPIMQGSLPPRDSLPEV